MRRHTRGARVCGVFSPAALGGAGAAPAPSGSPTRDATRARLRRARPRHATPHHATPHIITTRQLSQHLHVSQLTGPVNRMSRKYKNTFAVFHLFDLNLIGFGNHDSSDRK